MTEQRDTLRDEFLQSDTIYQSTSAWVAGRDAWNAGWAARQHEVDDLRSAAVCGNAWRKEAERLRVYCHKCDDYPNCACRGKFL